MDISHTKAESRQKVRLARVSNQSIQAGTRRDAGAVHAATPEQQQVLTLLITLQVYLLLYLSRIEELQHTRRSLPTISIPILYRWPVGEVGCLGTGVTTYDN